MLPTGVRLPAAAFEHRTTFQGRSAKLSASHFRYARGSPRHPCASHDDGLGVLLPLPPVPADSSNIAPLLQPFALQSVHISSIRTVGLDDATRNEIAQWPQGPSRGEGFTTVCFESKCAALLPDGADCKPDAFPSCISPATCENGKCTVVKNACQ